MTVVIDPEINDKLRKLFADLEESLECQGCGARGEISGFFFGAFQRLIAEAIDRALEKRAFANDLETVVRAQPEWSAPNWPDEETTDPQTPDQRKP